MKQIIEDSLRQWWSSPLPTIHDRDLHLLDYFDPQIKKIISVVGFRRVGKTFTLLDFASHYGKDNCVYFNFEDERLPKSTEVLTQLITSLAELKGQQTQVLLLDEIQEIPNWSQWARRINETTSYRLILSGSSSKLTSREIPTELRGHTISLPIFPLNWSEFLRFRRADLAALPHAQLLFILREYLTIGGLPEIVLAESGLRSLILTDYLSTFVNRDIIDRYHLRNTVAFSSLLRILPNTCNFTYSKLANTLHSLGQPISKATLIRYLSWLESSFFSAHLEIFSPNIKTRLQSVKKNYLIDNYFSTRFGGTYSSNIGHLMEQLVSNRLHQSFFWRPQSTLSFWKDYSDHEVDFVITHPDSPPHLFQVTYASTAADISPRETSSLITAARQLHSQSATIITWDFDHENTQSGLRIVYTPLWKWLSQPLPN